MTRVLVAVDDTEASVEAARAARRLFGDEADYYAINVTDPPVAEDSWLASRWALAYPVPWGATWPYMPASLDAPRLDEPDPTSEATSVARSTAAEAGLALAEATGDVGDPAEAILTASIEHDVDVIVVGSHDRGWLGKLFKPSVADAVVKHADVPVLVVS